MRHLSVLLFNQKLNIPPCHVNSKHGQVISCAWSCISRNTHSVSFHWEMEACKSQVLFQKGPGLLISTPSEDYPINFKTRIFLFHWILQHFKRITKNDNIYLNEQKTQLLLLIVAYCFTITLHYEVLSECQKWNQSLSLLTHINNVIPMRTQQEFFWK